MKHKKNLKKFSKKNSTGLILFVVRSILVFLLLAAMVSTQFAERNSRTSIDTVAENIFSSIDAGSQMQKSSNRMFKKFYGLNAGDYDGVIFYKPVSGMDAQEMLIVRLKNRSQSEHVVQAIEQRLASQKNSFEGYGVEQMALLENAVLDARGNYVFYIVHEEAGNADHAFRGSL